MFKSTLPCSASLGISHSLAPTACRIAPAVRVVFGEAGGRYHIVLQGPFHAHNNVWRSTEMIAAAAVLFSSLCAMQSFIPLDLLRPHFFRLLPVSFSSACFCRTSLSFRR